MKRCIAQTVCVWLAGAATVTAMSACAGTPTPAPEAPDTLAVWASHAAPMAQGVVAAVTVDGPATQGGAAEDAAARRNPGVAMEVEGDAGLPAEDASATMLMQAGPAQRPPSVSPVSLQPGESVDPSWMVTPALPALPEDVHAPTGPSLIDAPTALEPSLATSAQEATTQAETVPLPDLWSRIRGGLTMPDLDGPLVRNWERWYADRPDYVQRMAERASRYLFHIVEEVERRGLPAELALLPFIESAFNPQALSVAKASGIWQFMPATGKDFDLTQNLFRDDRRHVLASTDAALSYLQMLHGMFGDWHLALAAYNWGQGNVQRALDRQARTGANRPGYEQLVMPSETRNYVPKLQAVKNILRDPTAFGLSLPPLENHPYFAAVAIDRDIDVDLVARLAGLSIEDFHALNPQFNKPVILAAGTPEILLPYDNARQFEAALAAHPGPRASWTAWIAPRTLHPRDAAKQAGVSEARLREINRIPKGMLIRVGSTLLVPRPQGRLSDVSPVVADTARISLAPDGPRLQRKVVRAKAQGERLSALAKRHGVSPRNVASWNGLSPEAMLRPRQAIVLMVPGRPAGKAAKQAPAPAAKKPVATAVAKR